MTEYAVDKLCGHPQVFRDYLGGGSGQLITVHLMPCNKCNERCEFCSYRLRDNKNASAFDESREIPWPQMERLLDDFEEMGVQGIEVTGGGEPLLYKHSELLWKELGRRGFATALVTNGTLLDEHIAELIGQTDLKWARVSIDAATKETYGVMRHCPEVYFERAWQAVERLREVAPKNPDFRLGVGFVASNSNAHEVYDFVDRAELSSADNVRLSLVLSDRGVGYFDDRDALIECVKGSTRAHKDFDSPGFRIHNLIPKRAEDAEERFQNYARCATKDFLCVVEGAGRVYTCCTFTGSTLGYQGNIKKGGFKDLWARTAKFRDGLIPSDYCNTPCLYRDRNLAVMRMMGELPVLHKEFI